MLGVFHTRLPGLPRPGLHGSTGCEAQKCGAKTPENFAAAANWLAGHLTGARGLDLFAGSGALGLEALSRGAGHCDFVDSSRAAVNALRQHLDQLGCVDRGQVHHADAEHFIDGCGRYDIVFLDPPFSLRRVAEIANRLVAVRA